MMKSSGGRHHAKRLGQNLIALLFAMVVVVGCDFSADPGALTSPASPTLQTSGSQPAAIAMDGIAQRMAHLLGDSDFRDYVWQQMVSSTYKEGKLEFGRFAELENVRAAVERSGPGESAAWSDLLGDLPDLEFYVPVREHRENWDGSGEYIVAWQLIEEENPIGYTQDGQRVELDVDEVPSVPMFGLVPSETDFSRPGTRGAGRTVRMRGRLPRVQTAGFNFFNFSFLRGSGPPSGCDPAGATGEIVLWCTYISDDHEAAIRGDPELEVYLGGIVNPSNPTTAASLKCIGEENSDYNQDNEGVWNDGPVQIADSAWWASRVSAGTDSRHVMMVWEDDDTSCAIQAGLDWWVYAYDLEGIAYTVWTGTGWMEALFQSVLGWLSQPPGSGDDFVGWAVPDAWTDWGYTLLDENANPQGKLHIWPEPDVPPPGPLEISIAGPTEVQPSESCGWTAAVTGAGTPYTYAWSGVLSGSNSTVVGTVSAPGGYLYLSMTSDDGQHANTSLIITVDEEADECVF